MRTGGSRRCMPKTASRPRLFRRPPQKSGEATSCRREMAQHTVKQRGANIRVACLAFGISQTCYRYQAKQSAENIEIADYLVRLTPQLAQLGIRTVLSVSA